MRLFVAVPFPEPVVADLDAFLSPRRDADRRARGGPRWTDPDQWHLTLAFMGSVPDWRADALTERLEEVGARHPAAGLAVAGGGAFPSAASARALWAGVTDPGSRLAALARAVRGAANTVGAEPAGRRFHPHLTLARFPRPVEATRWVRVVEGYAGPEWTASEVVLVESHLGQESRGGRRRARHVELARVPLAASPSGSG